MAKWSVAALGHQCQMTPMHFKLDEHGFCWTSQVTLPSWAGYLDRKGVYGTSGAETLCDGSIELVFAPDGRDNSPLEPHELSLVQWVVDNAHEVSGAVIGAVLQEYPILQESYGYAEEEKAEYMPDLRSAEDLRRRIGLYAINVHQIEKDGMPYVGYEFGCTWDQEHGLGVLMHGTRCVAVGGGDTAILLWIARQDLDAS